MLGEINMIKGYRTACNITQQEMASALGITDKTYQKLESNPLKFTLEQMQKFTDEIKKKQPTTSISDIFLK